MYYYSTFKINTQFKKISVRTICSFNCKLNFRFCWMRTMYAIFGPHRSKSSSNATSRRSWSHMGNYHHYIIICTFFFKLKLTRTEYVTHFLKKADLNRVTYIHTYILYIHAYIGDNQNSGMGFVYVSTQLSTKFN